MRYLPLLLILITLIGCDGGNVSQSYADKCAIYNAKWKALDSCNRGSGCRLKDSEYSSWRQYGMLAIESCDLAIFEVEPVEEEVVEPESKEAGLVY